MDGEASQGVRIVKRWPKATPWLVVGLMAWFAPAVIAQAPTEPAAAPDSEAIASSIEMPWIPTPATDVPFLDISKAWPARLPLGANSRITIAIEQPREAWAFQHVQFGIEPNDADRSVAKTILTAAGLKFDPADPVASLQLEDTGSFIARYNDPRRKPNSRRTPGLDHFLIATLSPPSAGETLPRLERTSFAFYAPITRKDQTEAPTPKGIALVMPGIFGTPDGTLEALVLSLRRNGWHVLRMLAQPSRFTQTGRFTLDPAATDEQTDALGKEIATALGDRAAECAYAVEGAFQHLKELHPELASLPRVAIGFSGGAITLPIVVAREPDAYKAGILVGGAAHYWLINANSTYADMIAAVRLKWLAEPTLEQKRAIAEAYLRHAPMDAFHAAGVIRGKPMLMIQANADSAVPAVLGDVLWERLGRPDRWIKPGEHLPLFISIIKDLRAMNEWLDAAIAGEQPSDPTIPSKLPASPPDPAKDAK